MDAPGPPSRSTEDRLLPYVGGCIAVLSVAAVVYLSVAEGSAAAEAALVGLVGAVASTYFAARAARPSRPGNGTGNGTGTGNVHGNGSK